MRKHTERVHDLHKFVEQQPRTVKQVLQRYDNAPWVVEHIGYRVNLRTWSILGAFPNGGGFGKDKLNRELGESIAANCVESTIKVLSPYKPKVYV
jgi:hypothetical protein